MNKGINGKRQLIINIVANIFSWGIGLVINFVVTPYIVNNLGRDIYGFYGMANNVVNYVSLLSVAINSMAAKYITVELTKKNQVKSNEYFTTILFSNICLSVICAVVFSTVLINLSSIFKIESKHVSDVRLLYSFVFGAFELNIISSVFGASTYAKNRIDIKAYSTIIANCLRGGVNLFLFWLFRPSIVYLGIASFVVELYNLAAQVYFKEKLIPEISIKRIYLNLNLLWKMIKIGVWNSLNQMGDLLLSSSDLIASNILFGEGGSGAISLIKLFPAMISGIITAVCGAFLPRISIKYGQEDRQGMIKEVKYAQTSVGAVSVIFVMTIIIFSEAFYSLWVPRSNPKELSTLVVIDILRMVIVGCAWPLVNLCTILDKTRFPAIVVCGIGALNVISMVAFKDVFGIYVVVISTSVLSFVFYGLIIPLYVSSVLNVKWYSFIKVEVDACLAVLIIWFLGERVKKYFNLDNWINFLTVAGMSTIVIGFITIMIFSHLNLKKYWHKISKKSA